MKNEVKTRLNETEMIWIIKIVKTRSVDAEEKTKKNEIYPDFKLYVLEDLYCEDKFHRDTVKMQL